MYKNITLSADENIISFARSKAHQEKTSLNKLFREWLGRYTGRENIAERYDYMMEELSLVTPGEKFTRDDMNER